MKVADAIPHYMRGGIVRWITIGQMPGSFLCAVLRNDLMDACRRADDTNIKILPEYVRFLEQHAPFGSYGTRHWFEEWGEARRREGPFAWEWPT